MNALRLSGSQASRACLMSQLHNLLRRGLVRVAAGAVVAAPLLSGCCALHSCCTTSCDDARCGCDAPGCDDVYQKAIPPALRAGGLLDYAAPSAVSAPAAQPIGEGPTNPPLPDFLPSEIPPPPAPAPPAELLHGERLIEPPALRVDPVGRVTVQDPS